MSTRALVLLGIVAAALLGYVLVFERGSVTSQELAARKGRVLPTFVREKVERLSVQRKNQEVVLERKRDKDGLGNFTLVSPIQAAADSDAVDRLLGELEWLSARRTLEPSAEERKRYGVDAPRFRVSYVAGGQRHVLAVGQDDVHGEGLYVRVDDEPHVFVVPKTLLEVVDFDPMHFRDKSLFPELTVAWATKLEVRTPQRTHTLVKDGGHWWLEDPKAKRYADDKRIADVLEALSSLRGKRDVGPDQRAKAEQALTSPTLVVLASMVPDEAREDKQARAFSLEVGAPCGEKERYARASIVAGDARYVCIAEEDLAPLQLGELELAEPRLFRATPSDVERFVISRGKDQLAWRREGTGWKSDVGAPADRDAIEGWLKDLASARALRSSALSGFTERGRLRLELSGGKHEELSYGALASDGSLPVRRGDEALLVSFPGSVFDRLTPARERFVPLAPWAKHAPSEVVRFLARAHGKQRSATLEAGTWRSDTPIDALRVRELVRDLISFSARSYVVDQARPEHGFTADKPRLELGLQDGSTLALALGTATDRGAYARIGDAVFEVGSDVIARIDELAGGPRAPGSAEPQTDEDDGEIHGHEEGVHEH
jgi:hypothetical protein